jgi:hypothetical protein
VAGVSPDLRAATVRARDVVDSGAAGRVLDHLIEFTRGVRTEAAG